MKKPIYLNLAQGDLTSLVSKYRIYNVTKSLDWNNEIKDYEYNVFYNQEKIWSTDLQVEGSHDPETDGCVYEELGRMRDIEFEILTMALDEAKRLAIAVNPIMQGVN